MLAGLRTRLAKLRRDRRGGIAVTFAMSLPVLLGAMGLASDYGMMIKIRGDLQKAADAAAMAGANEISVARSNESQVKSAAQSYAAYSLTGNSAATARDLAGSQLVVTTEVVDKFSAVTVAIENDWTPFFAHFLMHGITPIRVSAKARFVGNNNLCVLGLSAADRAVYLDKNARLTGNNCGVYSNSTSADGLTVNMFAFLKASLICSAGGSRLSASASVDPKPITECPVMADPLASRAAPSVGGCDHQDYELTDETRTLDPGVYCGGLAITGTSRITLNPGIYVMKNGGLRITGSSSFTGKGVGIFMTGSAPGSIQFTMGSHIDLSAAVDGPLAGLLIFEDRSNPPALPYRITSDDARRLIGTIYLPVSKLIVDSKSAVADRSAYTAIIVKTLELNKGPNLVLNSDYDMTDVPVPEGIKGVKQVILTQ